MPSNSLFDASPSFFGGPFIRYFKDALWGRMWNGGRKENYRNREEHVGTASLLEKEKICSKTGFLCKYQKHPCQNPLIWRVC